MDLLQAVTAICQGGYSLGGVAPSAIAREFSRHLHCTALGAVQVRPTPSRESCLHLHMLVEKWNQELHFALILGILLSEFNY